MGEECTTGGGVLLVFRAFHIVFLASFKQLLPFTEWDFFSFLSPPFTGEPVYSSFSSSSHHFRFF